VEQTVANRSEPKAAKVENMASTSASSEHSTTVKATDCKSVMYLTPIEMFVWEYIVKSMRIIDNGDMRFPICHSEEALRKEWKARDELFVIGETLKETIQRFIDAGMIQPIGQAGNGYIPHRFTRHPDSYFIIAIEKRKIRKVKPGWIELIRTIQRNSSNISRLPTFSVNFKLWVNNNSALIKGASAYPILTYYHPDKPYGWGIIIRNPEHQKESPPSISKYLVAEPGFEAYTFVCEESSMVKGDSDDQPSVDSQELSGRIRTNIDELRDEPEETKYAGMTDDELNSLAAELEQKITELYARHMALKKEYSRVTELIKRRLEDQIHEAQHRREAAEKQIEELQTRLRNIKS